MVFDHELKTAASLIRTAVLAGADAFIVQDLGVARLIKQMCPDANLCASTQMAVHNLDGVRLLEEMGFHRAVLARELSEKEIFYIKQHSHIELEVFVHGALCMGMSGQCYLSSFFGGRSGNRGLCASPAGFLTNARTSRGLC